jgi:hypothetical protein
MSMRLGTPSSHMTARRQQRVEAGFSLMQRNNRQ